MRLWKIYLRTGWDLWALWLFLEDKWLFRVFCVSWVRAKDPRKNYRREEKSAGGVVCGRFLPGGVQVLGLVGLGGLWSSGLGHGGRVTVGFCLC